MKASAALKPLALLFCLGTAALSAPAFAGTVSDLIMANGLLAESPEGEVLRYSHERHIPASDSEFPGMGKGLATPKEVVDGEAVLNAVESSSGLQLVLVLTEAGKSREVASFPAKGANPMLLFFLENVVRNMAIQTGGSPFYIRNRIREALVAAELGGQSEGQAVVTLQPFEGDPNLDPQSDFASLRLSLTLDPDRPSRIISLKADTAAGAAGYSESMVLIGAE